MAVKAKTKKALKVGGAIVAAVVGYDVYKAHTGGPRPHSNRPGAR